MEDTKKLLLAINKVADKTLDDSQLQMLFVACWPELQKKLETIHVLKTSPEPVKRPLESMVSSLL
jgi:L-fucose isomerase-like protein